MRNFVRILLLGETGVGKTSLILALVSEEFPEEVPAKAEEITIPADVTPEKVPTHIVDFSPREQDENSLIEEVLKAHVICLVYSVEDAHTLNKIKSFWIPFIRDHLSNENSKPIILVGNKSDTLEVGNMESILPIMNEYSEIETVVECSAKTLKNISEVFYYAQKAVLHPTAPLYLTDNKELTSGCRKALSRIFNICDVDNDGLLNDREIYQFQRRCFNVPLQPQALEDVKSVVRKHINDGVAVDSITQSGFLFLHTLFIQRGRHETTWTVLRKFGYSDNLVLTNDYLHPYFNPPSLSTTELTHQGYSFLINLFEKNDKDNDGALSPIELKNLFDTCPVLPWLADVSNSVLTNSSGWITLDGYLAQWTLKTFMDVRWTLEHLAYLGYMYEHENQLSAVHVTREKKKDSLSLLHERNVFHCHVLGAKGVGKTSFLQAFLGRNLQYLAALSSNQFSKFTINTIQVYDENKYLLLQEIDCESEDAQPLTLSMCDVACLLYDLSNSQSFHYCTQVYKRYAEAGIPCFVVGCKSDRRPVPQVSALQPSQFCREFGLPQPQLFTCIDRINQNTFSKIATLAAYPHLHNSLNTESHFILKLSFGMAVGAGLGYLLFRFLKAR